MCESLKTKGRFTLIESSTYFHEGWRFKVNCDASGRLSPLSTEILSKFVNEILAMRELYSRVCAFRFDLHVPEGMSVLESNKLMSQLFAKLKDKFKAKKWDNQPIKKFIYGWVWEINTSSQAHYHLWMALPGNQVKHAGHTDYGIFKIIKELWSELTGGKGTPHLPDNPAYMITRDDEVELRNFVYRVSYLAKEKDKYSSGDNTKRFDGSRLHGAMMKKASVKFAA